MTYSSRASWYQNRRWFMAGSNGFVSMIRSRFIGGTGFYQGTTSVMPNGGMKPGFSPRAKPIRAKARFD
jgi:hypothetical protein